MRITAPSDASGVLRLNSIATGTYIIGVEGSDPARRVPNGQLRSLGEVLVTRAPAVSVFELTVPDF